MVSAVIDPIRVPTINQSPAEIAEIQALIEQGQLPKDFLKRHIDAVDANVYGFDAPKDRRGFRLEQGLGSSRNQTQQSIDAYIKYHSKDADFDENLTRMKTELAECNKQREAKAGFHYGRNTNSNDTKPSEPSAPKAKRGRKPKPKLPVTEEKPA